MACLNPVNIVNPSKYINARLLHPYLLSVPCGKCSSCVNSKVLEIRQRIHYHLLGTFKSGGFCIFDTLTYSEDNVPWFSDVLNSYLGFSVDGLPDFRTFFYRDVTLFLKRLRKWLSYYYPSSHLTYCYFSEYGQDDRYTHRPHYHFLFFITGVSPSNDFYFAFNDAVRSTWSLGINDSYSDTKRFLSPLDWVKHAVVTSDSYSISQIQSISCYLSKYVSKSLEFDKVSFSHLSCVRSFLFSSYSSSDAVSLYNKFKSLISPTHRWSKGFGLYALSLYDLSYVLRYHSIPVPDKYDVKIDVPLSVYYQRKYFYYVHVADDGSKSWRLNEDGLIYLWNKLLTRYSRVLSRYRDLLVSYPDLNESVTKLLNGRSLESFVFYVVCYRGRVMLPSVSDNVKSFSDLLPLEKVCRLDYLRASFPVPRTFYDNFISRSSDVPSSVRVDGCYISIPEFCRLFVYCQSSLPDWKDFDLIYLMFLYPTKLEYIRSIDIDHVKTSFINRLKF